MKRIAALLVALLASGTVVDGEDLDFNRDIRPILSNQCFQCHGPDSGQRQAELRLDRRDGLFRDADGVSITVPGQLEASELWNRINSGDPETVMPPPDSGKQLSAQDRGLIKEWIKTGARWKGHWAYLPVEVREAVPAGVGKSSVIDRLVQSRLKSRGLTQSPRADPSVLLRRLHLDLHGLAPAPEQAHRFLSEQNPESYEKLVDELLASEKFGERMAMYWLDLVRYADTNGIHGDNHRDISLYRDWVIAAFNQNRPFDQFTVDQIAGDLLENRTNRQLIASGYNRLLMTTREGGAQAKEYLAKYAADRVRNVSAVWLGATLGCAECHDHKYDPYSTRDFYRMAAFFADVQEVAVGTQPSTAIPSEAQQDTLHRIAERRRVIEREMAEDSAVLHDAQQKWEVQMLDRLKAAPAVWQPIPDPTIRTTAGTKLVAQEDGSLLATGPNPEKDSYIIEFAVDGREVTGIRLEALTHPQLTNGSLSRANGNFVLTNVEVVLINESQPEGQPVAVQAAIADFSQKDYPVANSIDGKSGTGWAVDGHNRKENRSAVFVFKNPVPVGSSRLRVSLHHDSMFAKHNIGCFRLSLTDHEKPGLEDELLPQPLVMILKKTIAERSDDEASRLRQHFRSQCLELAPQRDELVRLKKQSDEVTSQFRRTLVTTSMQPRMVRVLPRGNWLDESGEQVEPGVPEFLSQIGGEGRANRLDLARWIVDPANPLTARVFVNRVWKLLFGHGIVRTLDDFGSQGSWPSHPELLDWLANEFIQSGWDVKQLVRLIVLSETYQQTSAVTDQVRRIDPENQWLSRQTTYRLDAEMIRDSALLSSGLLVERIGGPSAKPYQPAGYWAHLNFPKRAWKADSGDGLYRRGLYTYWCRTFLHPSLLAFDASTREECAVERPRSNNPLQALVLLNDPTYVEAARALAERVVLEIDGKPDQPATRKQIIDRMYELVLIRKPSDSERTVLDALQQEHQRWYKDHPEEAAGLLSVGARKASTDLAVDRVAAWTSVARALFNLHETITRN